MALAGNDHGGPEVGYENVGFVDHELEIVPLDLKDDASFVEHVAEADDGVHAWLRDLAFGPALRSDFRHDLMNRFHQDHQGEEGLPSHRHSFPQTFQLHFHL